MKDEQKWIKKIQRNRREHVKYYKEIYAFIYKQTLDTELSLDLTQELFISFQSDYEGFQGKKMICRIKFT